MNKNPSIIFPCVFIFVCLNITSHAEILTVPPPSTFNPEFRIYDNDQFHQEERAFAVEQALNDLEAADYFKEADPLLDAQEEVHAETDQIDTPKSGPSIQDHNVIEPKDTLVKNDRPAAGEGSVIPPWLKRTSFGTVIESDRKPRLYFETVQPLYQTPDMANTVLTQGRVSVSGGNEDYSAGLGYRRLLASQNLILGINNFFDYTSNHRHYRTGVGLEAISPTLEFRANSYIGLSGKRLVEETGPVKVYERAATGYDVELGGPLLASDRTEHDQPTVLNWLKIFGGYYWYNFKESNDISGWKIRAEIKPLNGIGLNLSMLGNNKDERSYMLDFRVNLLVADFRPQSILSALKTAAIPSEISSSMDTRTLERIERSFDVKVERWSEGHVSVPPGMNTSVGNLTNVQLVTRFPSVNGVGPGTDPNSNGTVDPGEDFEVDIFATNASGSNSTGISYANATVTSPGFIAFNTSSPLSDITSGATGITDTSTDLDILILAGANVGDQFYITLDMTADGETRTLTFGPFTVGSIVDGQVNDQI